MGIVSSSYTVGHNQIDGRNYVVEDHVDSLGNHYRGEYGPIVDSADYQAILDTRAAALTVQLGEEEADLNVNRNAAPTLQQQTAAEFAARFWNRVRRAYTNGDKFNFERLMYWLIERITAGDITDAQARSTFNTAYNQSLTAGQWTTLKANRITPAHDRWAAILTESDLA